MQLGGAVNPDKSNYFASRRKERRLIINSLVRKDTEDKY